MEKQFILKTCFNKDEIISEFANEHEVLIRDFINLRDRDIKRALIELGWTPPGLCKGVIKKIKSIL